MTAHDLQSFYLFIFRFFVSLMTKSKYLKTNVVGRSESWNVPCRFELLRCLRNDHAILNS
jgi:hypothetical protein